MSSSGLGFCSGMVLDETKWDFSKPSIGLGDVTLVSVGGFLDSSPPHEDKPTPSTAPHTEASDTDSSNDKILKNTTINDLYKGLEVITQLLKDITNSVKDDPVTNKKIKEASETLAKISIQTTEILSLDSMGLEASGALSKKSKRPTSKNPPTETKVTSPKPMEGFEKSYLVSSRTIPDPQDLKKDIQLASTDCLPHSMRTLVNHNLFLRSSPPHEDKPTPSTAPHTEASDTDSSNDKILKKYDDTLPIFE
nr:hypothetical protein [Tanacetum cinerariifolium]